MKEAQEEYFACGAQVKNQEPQGKKIDDTSANGLIIYYCHKDDWRKQEPQTVIKGVKGEWGPIKMCNVGTYVYNMQVKQQYWLVLNDNTATNGISILCCDPKDGCEETNEHTVEAGNWGIWRAKSTPPDNQYVCGVEVQDDPVIETKSDNTALNGIRLKMCSIEPEEEK